MSLWTPGGEVPIERNPSGGAEPSGGAPQGAGSPGLTGVDLAEAAAAAGIDLDSLSPEERARAEEFIGERAQAQQRIADTPAEALVANHAVGLYDLAAIKLSVQPPALDEARLAIDALAALLDATGDRLGEPAGQLRQAVDQLRMAWVQVRDAAGGDDAPPEA